ncbi:hypothetical protein PMIT1313_00285 [Prochlorococcus marinus str. MIT 1313]|uniref:hypothetical protein n=1 Tax=Prochlorococcus TaxID=1218 RepID=UPI0007BC0FAC|nr:hypothetical protein [Prochlorococcus marinus]KZR70631.1 hypothetical protein PMIT1313_00285 [Prochlorococcus marinus str. MIT 1313]KZR73140.1 hypothetical protein PMIT1318_00473 [Prochlorococcus marinus str. MIT 1318]
MERSVLKGFRGLLCGPPLTTFGVKQWQAKAQIANENLDNQFFYSINDALKADYREIRRLDLKKRLGVLLYRRERMERELEAIKVALSTLEAQMQRNVAYERLSICHKSSP